MAAFVATSAQDIIDLALNAVGVKGVGQTSRAEDINRSLRIMNGMLAQWQRKRWLVWHELDIGALMNGSLAYAIGPGGYFNVPRPDRIEYAYIRLPAVGGGPDFGSDFGPDFATSLLAIGQPIDFPLRLLQSREDYSRITLKNLASFPQFLFYDSTYPVGFLYPWPVPSSQYELHVVVKENLTAFALPSSAFAMPDEYIEALWTNLTLRLGPIYQYPLSEAIVALARASLNTLRQANTQVPALTIPRALTGRGNGYNIYGDTGASSY